MQAGANQTEAIDKDVRAASRCSLFLHQLKYSFELVRFTYNTYWRISMKAPEPNWFSIEHLARRWGIILMMYMTILEVVQVIQKQTMTQDTNNARPTRN